MLSRRVYTGIGYFIIKFTIGPDPIRDSLKVLHAGPLELEVVDPVVIKRVMTLVIYDLMREIEHAHRTTR